MLLTRPRRGLSQSTFQGSLPARLRCRPRMSIIRWHIDTAYVPLPDGGRPHCTLVAKDTLDNTYELDIPPRPQKTYRS